VDSVGMSMNYAARDAVLQWQFSPGGKDGRPVSVRIDVALFFDAIRATTGVSLDCKEVRTAAGSKVPTCSSGQIETAQFRSPDGIFEFSYPSWLVLHADAEKSGGYLCHDSIVCVEYPRELYEGYDFGSAEFWVNNNPVQVLDIRHGAQPTTTEADCLTFRTNKPVSTTVINGKKFATWFVGGAAGGTTSHIEFFRTFHNGKCYQLGTSVSISSTGYGKEDYESGRLKHFTAADEEKVRAVLDGIVKTFRFLK